jgi:hypothetical protein
MDDMPDFDTAAPPAAQPPKKRRKPVKRKAAAPPKQDRSAAIRFGMAKAKKRRKMKKRVNPTDKRLKANRKPLLVEGSSPSVILVTHADIARQLGPLTKVERAAILDKLQEDMT